MKKEINGAGGNSGMKPQNGTYRNISDIADGRGDAGNRSGGRMGFLVPKKAAGKDSQLARRLMRIFTQEFMNMQTCFT